MFTGLALENNTLNLKEDFTIKRSDCTNKKVTIEI